MSLLGFLPKCTVSIRQPKLMKFPKINDSKVSGCRDKKRTTECHRLEENKKTRQFNANLDL